MDISDWNVSKVKHFDEMFYRLFTTYSDNVLDLSKWDNNGGSPTTSRMFAYMGNSLSTMKLPNMHRFGITDMDYLYEHNEMTTLDLTPYSHAYRINSMRGAFKDCKNMKTCLIERFTFRNVVTMDYAWAGCTELENLDISKCGFWAYGLEPPLTSFKGVFKNCKNLERVKGIEQFRLDNVDSIAYTFYGAESFTGYEDVVKMPTENVSDFSYLFYHNVQLYRHLKQLSP